MPNSTPIVLTARRLYVPLFKAGVLGGVLAAVLVLLGVPRIAGPIGWAALLCAAAGVVLAGVATSEPD